MLRTLSTLLLTVSLVACPWRCSGFGSGRGDADWNREQTAAGCSCCERPQRVAHAEPAEDARSTLPGREPAPADPDDGCSCDCLCAGALSKDLETVRGLLGSRPVLPLMEPVPATGVSAADHPAAVLNAGPPFPAHPAGRSLRYAIRSWQI